MDVKKVVKKRAKKTGGENLPVKESGEVEELKKKTGVKKIKKSNYTIDGKLIHIKVGDASFPATDEDITKITAQIQDIIDGKEIDCILLVTHHAVNVNVL